MSIKTPYPTDKYVGRRLKMRRLMLGMSQEALGDSIGLTFQQVQKYEKGANRIGAGRLQHIANILRVPVSFFFEGAPGNSQKADLNNQASEYVNDFLTTSHGLALVEAFMRIKSKKLQKQIVDMVVAISDEC